MIEQHDRTLFSTSVSVEDSQLCYHEEGFLRLSLFVTQELFAAITACIEIFGNNSDTNLLVL